MHYLIILIFRGEWSEEEDIKLLELITRLEKKWSQISRKMAGRNEYSVKNRFYYIMKTCKMDAFTSTYEDLNELVKNKKEELIKKRNKLIQEQNLNNNLQNAMNLNSENIQIFLQNYQNYVHFQSYCLYKKNIEQFLTDFQQKILQFCKKIIF